MRFVFAFIVGVHGLIHLMGPAKAFGLAELPQLTHPISRPMGVAWLTAALLTLATAVALFVWPRGWWMLGASAAVLSQVVVVGSWADAKAGTAANVLLLAGVVYGFLTQGPTSFRVDFERGIAADRERARETAAIAETDLEQLPDPVRRYLRATGFVGKPRVASYRVRFRGRIRSAPDARWMPFTAEQESFVGPPSRSFLMRATLLGVPMEALHRLSDGHATMQVKTLGAITMVDAHGPEMDRSETVTLFNDMCILAPGTLIDPAIAWEPVDAHVARARFTNGEHTISATLSFDDEGLLTDFVSDDRSRSSADGKTFTRTRFSTPVRSYRSFGPYRIASYGEARWHAPDGEFAYGEFETLEVSYGEEGF